MITFLAVVFILSVTLHCGCVIRQLKKEQFSMCSLKVDIGIFVFNTLLILLIIFLQN